MRRAVLTVAMVAVAAMLSGCGTIDLAQIPLRPLLDQVEQWRAEPPVPATADVPGAEIPATTNKPVKVSAGRYRDVNSYRVTCTMDVDEAALANDRHVRWTLSVDPPWSDYDMGSWRAAGELVLMVDEGEHLMQYWADYYERGRQDRQWSELAYHAREQGAKLASGQQVWICACDGDRSHGGSVRSEWVPIAVP